MNKPATNMRLFGSDPMAEMLRALGMEYIALTPGASFRGLHDSLVNHLGNANPRMLLCIHEESAVALAHGWTRVTGTPMRRPQEMEGGPVAGVIVAGPVRIDIDRHQVTVNGQPVSMPLKEFDLLEILLANAGRVLTRDVLIDRIWGPNYYGDTKTLDVHIKRLRAKVEEGLEKLAFDLQFDIPTRMKVEEFKADLLDNPALARWIEGMWEQGRAALLRVARDPDAALAGKFTESKHKAGEVIHEEGSTGRSLVVVADGTVELTLSGPYKGRLRQGLATRGDYFGDGDLVGEAAPAPAVKALSAVTLLTLDRAAIERLRAEHIQAADAASKRLTQALADTVVVEAPLEIRLGGQTLATIMRTPGQERELAAGVLVQQWNGPRRLDRRLSSLRPLGVTPPAPPGVDRAAWTLLWAAWVLCGRPSAENLLALAPPVPPGRLRPPCA